MLLKLRHTLLLCLLFSICAFADPGSKSNSSYLTIGDTAPDIVLKNHKGSKKKLSKYQGKVVLVQFWASWCLPCRHFSDEWIEVYDKYRKEKFTRGKGFEIYSVSLDKDKKAWKKAIKQDGLPWKANTRDKKGWDSDYAFVYGIQSLPADFLLDENGNIIAKNVTPYELDNILRGMKK